jgi:hypothetical protein
MSTPAKEIIGNFTHIRIPSFIGNQVNLYKPESQKYFVLYILFAQVFYLEKYEKLCNTNLIRTIIFSLTLGIQT